MQWAAVHCGWPLPIINRIGQSLSAMKQAYSCQHDQDFALHALHMCITSTVTMEVPEGQGHWQAAPAGPQHHPRHHQSQKSGRGQAGSLAATSGTQNSWSNTDSWC